MSLRPAGILFRAHALDNYVFCRPSTNLGRIIVNFPATAIPTTSARLSVRHVVTSTSTSTSSRLRADYFVSNSLSHNQPSSRGTGSTPATAQHQQRDLLPHRRRQAAKRSNNASSEHAGVAPLPPDASSVLTTASERQPAHSLRRQVSLLLSLSKPRLTVLVVLTAMVPYALYPVPAFLSPSIGLDTPSLSPLTLAFLTAGTALCSASANALNMLYEPAWDAVMSRTRNRPLVRGLLSERRALVFAIAAAVAGVGALYFGVNPTVAFLGAANITLYAGIYTPLKRVSWLNTWVGAVVGGIPPLMGWAAAAGESATGDGSFHELLLTADAAGGWLLAALLFAWQFPHFMALSWPVREEYRAAGHKMLCWIDPLRNARVALRYSLVFMPLCVALCAAGVTEWSFAVTSLPVNAWLAREAVRFWQNEGFKGSARGLFWASVWHLPVVLVLALVQKKGMWSRVWRSVVGEPDLEEEEDDEGDWFEEDDIVGQDDNGTVGGQSGGTAPSVGTKVD
ncbi:UbiA prenyltransferase family-domain-containing protein [Biscogniauxia mediterranea]|nr:UbiA prenyltransferase family-domain-containing protein [Biscogniauxia mediterranea]